MGRRRVSTKRTPVVAGVVMIVAATVVVLVVVLVVVTREPATTPTLPRHDASGVDVRNGRVFVQSNLWNADDRQYAVWVDDTDGAFAAQRRAGRSGWEVVDLGAVAGNPLSIPVADNQHNVFSIGTDAAGHVHIMGNMHGDELRYVRSARPHDLTTLEAAELPGAGERITYPRLVGLPDGTLLFFRREGSAGDGATVLDRLAPGSATWEHVGPIIDGRPTAESPYLHQVAVDGESGAIHLLFVWRGGRGHMTNTDVSYARSPDGGSTWTTAGGDELALPITHDTAEIVIDTGGEGSGLHNHGGLTVDADGRPVGAVAFGAAGIQRLELVRYDGRSWQRQHIDEPAIAGRPAVIAGADDGTWLIGVHRGELAIAPVTPDGVGDIATIGAVPRGWEPAVDSDGLDDGQIELLLPEGDDPTVVSIGVDDLP